MNQVDRLIRRTYEASAVLQGASNSTIKKALQQLAAELVKNTAAILRANKKDLLRQDPADPKTDRLLLNEARIKSIAAAIKTIAALPCPAGQILEEKTLANGLRLQRRTAPLGVVGAIYESRPNVTFDIAALSLRSKNACLLKGSRDAHETNRVSVALIQRVLKAAGLPADAVTLLPPEREVLDQVFTATRYIDVIIPRGSAGLIQHVRKNSLVPTIETGAGVCHIYVEKDADLDKAVKIVVNAKVSRPSVCNALDTVIVDAAIAKAFADKLLPQLAQHGVEIYAEPKAFAVLKGYPASEKRPRKKALDTNT
jgi:glutamate-5-semialdehyde dehydrogenase